MPAFKITRAQNRAPYANARPNMYLGLLAIFKNETLNLRIWLDHYIAQGVEHFWLIDNGSTDSPREILRDYTARVTYKWAPQPPPGIKYDARFSRQAVMYQSMFREHDIGHAVEWLIVADLDEFFHAPGSTLAHRLHEYSPETAVIACNWRQFGTAGLKHPANIFRDITTCDPILAKEVKYIVRLRHLQSVADLNVHDAGLRPRIVNDVIQLNHYPIQSWEYFSTVKMTRGDVQGLVNYRNEEYYKKIAAQATIQI